jgi:hypothetical protein
MILLAELIGDLMLHVSKPKSNLMSTWISLYLTYCNTFAPPPGMYQ